MRIGSILLQEIHSDIDESARSAVFGELIDECFRLLDESFEGCGAGFAEAYCMCVSRCGVRSGKCRAYPI